MGSFKSIGLKLGVWVCGWWWNVRGCPTKGSCRTAAAMPQAELTCREPGVAAGSRPEVSMTLNRRSPSWARPSR